MGRMTLQGALRFDNAWSYSPAQTIGPALINGQTFLSTPLTFDRTDGVNYKDISPRGGLACDVFGNGKTAVKINVGKYMDPASNLNNNYSISNPIARIATTATRTWTDNGTGGPGTPGYGDNIPQCDLTNNAANGECAASGAATFGTATRTTAAIDPALLNGWGIRPRRLAVRRVGPAAADAARLGRGRLLQAVAAELHGHRQPARDVRRLHAVQHHGAVGSAAARRRRLHRRHDCTTSVPAKFGQTGQQHHGRRQLRRRSTRATTACCSTSAPARARG